MNLEKALPADLPAVVALMNRAYRGEAKQVTWNTEAAYISGDRTSLPLLEADIAGAPDASLLIARTAADGPALTACVWLEPLGDHVWYLGSLTVDPAIQLGGMGHRLLAAAEDWVRARGGRTIRMTVVHVREGLIAWYQRRSYRLTGETRPFPYDDHRFGVPTRPDLHFVVLEKTLDTTA